MNKKAQTSEQLISQVVFVILIVVFISGMYIYVKSQEDGAAVWEDYWGKEIAKIINLGSVGEEIVLDVHSMTKIAKKSGVEYDKIFTFNNEKREGCVQLKLGRKTCYTWFNNVIVKDSYIELGKESKPINKLRFKIASGGVNA